VLASDVLYVWRVLWFYLSSRSQLRHRCMRENGCISIWESVCDQGLIYDGVFGSRSVCVCVISLTVVVCDQLIWCVFELKNTVPDEHVLPWILPFPSSEVWMGFIEISTLSSCKRLQCCGKSEHSLRHYWISSRMRDYWALFLRRSRSCLGVTIEALKRSRLCLTACCRCVCCQLV